MFTWLLPIFMTVQILRNKQITKYNNYLSFWCLASLLFGIDWISGYILHSLLMYRIIRLSFLIWISIDNCHNSTYLVNAFFTPVIDQHRRVIDDTFEMINTNVDKYSKVITGKAKAKINDMAAQSGQSIMTGVFNLASTAQQSLSNITVSSVKVNNPSDDISNAESSNSNKKDEKKDDNSSPDIVSDGEVVANGGDNKEPEN